MCKYKYIEGFIADCCQLDSSVPTPIFHIYFYLEIDL